MQLWAIQTKLKQEDSTIHLADAFQKLGLNWAAFPVLPFKDFIPDFDWDGPIVYYGSTSLLKMAAARNHTPLFFDEHAHKPSNYGQKFGDFWLNNNGIFYPVSELMKDEHEEVLNAWHFFRPDIGTKQFAGGVMSLREFQEMAKYLIANNAMTEDDIVCCNKPKLINKEWRTWIVDGEPVACVGYRQNDKVRPWKPNDAEAKRIKDFARMCAMRHQPSKIFVLDVADTPEGLKLVEINSFHSAGFYLPDHILDVVAEVSNYVGKHF